MENEQEQPQPQKQPIIMVTEVKDEEEREGRRSFSSLRRSRSGEGRHEALNLNLARTGKGTRLTSSSCKGGKEGNASSASSSYLQVQTAMERGEAGIGIGGITGIGSTASLATTFNLTSHANNGKEIEKEGGEQGRRTTLDHSNPQMAKTMSYMWSREMSRISHGHYTHSPGEVYFTAFLICSFAVMVGYAIWGYSTIDYYYKNWDSLSLLALVFPLFIWILLQLSLVLRWVLYWAVITAGLLILVQNESGFGQDPRQVAEYIVIGFAAIEACTLMVYLFSRVFYINLLTSIAASNPERIFKIKPSPQKENTYMFQGFLQLSRKEMKFSYVGDLNEEGVPHGYGKWTSMWPFGEVLEGHFDEGKPVGPFTSREYKTGYAFKNLRIGFVAHVDKFKSTTLRRSMPLGGGVLGGQPGYGVAAVECSVAGRFFSDLPRATLLFDPFLHHQGGRGAVHHRDGGGGLTSIKEVVANLSPLHGKPRVKNSAANTRIVVEYDSELGFVVPGFVAPKSLRERKTLQLSHTELSLPENGLFSHHSRHHHLNSLSVDGWKRRDLGKEAVLFIPGFNISLKQSLETLGQMIALGNLSPEFKPIVFNWPGGPLVGYPWAVKVSESRDVKEDLVRTIRELAKSGISRIHILCHSLGARVLMNAHRDFDRMFIEREDSQLSSFLPSTSVNDDRNHEGRLQLASVTLMNPETPLEAFKQVKLPRLKLFTRLVTIYANNSDIALISAEFINRQKILGLRVHDLYKKDAAGEKIPLDVDVIDTSLLDSNIQSAKHCYFNLNKYIVDDIFDIITNGRRARDREHRLLEIEGNVYSILSAPSYITN